MTNEIQVRIGGTFSESGFLANGFFQGIYSYDPSSQDINPNVNNVGVFDVPLFEIRIFDSQSNLIDTLNETNSIARIILSDFDSEIPGADEYKFSTTQDTKTNSNGFYEFGAIDLTFDWDFGGTTTSAPTMAPVDFEDGMFASYAATEGWDGVFNPQSVKGAEIFVDENENEISIVATQNASEPDSDGQFNVNLSESTISDTVVTYTVAGTATPNQDYTALSGTVTIPAGSLTASIDISVLDDFDIDGNENVTITLDSITARDSNVKLSPTKSSATITIADNDLSPSSITLEAEAADTIVNYRTEKIKSASGHKVLSFLNGGANEVGSATFGFNGAVGNYDLILGAYDENDGLAQFVVELNDVETGTTTQIGSWVLDDDLGSNVAKGKTFVSPTVAFGVSLTPGDTITVNGFEDGNEHARLDFIQFEPSDGSITIEAEYADTIVNYRRENVSTASGGELLSFLNGGTNEVGSATFGFNGAVGNYDILLGTYDENDGEAQFVLELNDFETDTTTEIGTLELNQNLGSNTANAQTFVSPIVATGINLTEGDSITVHGFEDALEHARLDFIQLQPVVI